MKKKGLIISTIVMVVVLIASLTTATYAWFNASAKTSVDQITLTIDANSAVAIGAHSGAGNTQNDYMYNTVTLGHGASGAALNTPTYSGGQKGLGTKLGFNTETKLNLSTGVGTSQFVTERVIVDQETTTPGAISQADPAINPDTRFDPSHKIFKANSVDGDDGTVDLNTVLYAQANTDFIALKMGAQAAQSGVKGIYARVTVKTTDTDTTLKMSAALHFYIKVGANYQEFDLFGTATDETSKDGLGGSGITVGGNSGVALSYETEQAVATFEFLIAGDGTYSGADLATNGSAITPFEIYAYVWGPDEDCVSTATGCGVSIDIEFMGIQKQADEPTSLITWAV